MKFLQLALPAVIAAVAVIATNWLNRRDAKEQRRIDSLERERDRDAQAERARSERTYAAEQAAADRRHALQLQQDQHERETQAGWRDKRLAAHLEYMEISQKIWHNMWAYPDRFGALAEADGTPVAPSVEWEIPVDDWNRLCRAYGEVKLLASPSTLTEASLIQRGISKYNHATRGGGSGVVSEGDLMRAFGSVGTANNTYKEAARIELGMHLGPGPSGTKEGDSAS